jgi:microcystin-dependent protein
MGLEVANFVNDLTTTNPVTSDVVAQGDDHLRLLKNVLKNTFPGYDRAFPIPTMVSQSTNFAPILGSMNTTFLVSTAGGIVNATLPSLAAADVGWQCHFIKTNAGLNPLLIFPPAGTLQSGEYAGLTRARRCIPGHRTTAMWTGSGWFLTRVPHLPVGTCVSFDGASLPVGYEWPNGQTLASASTNYPEYNTVMGSGVTRDRRGRVDAAMDTLGLASANRLTGQSGGVDADVLGAAGGLENHVLTEAQLAAHFHSGTTSINGNHSHTITRNEGIVVVTDGVAANGFRDVGNAPTSTNGDHQHTMTTDTKGSNSAHNNVQPTIIANKILVVE